MFSSTYLRLVPPPDYPESYMDLTIFDNSDDFHMNIFISVMHSIEFGFIDTAYLNVGLRFDREKHLVDSYLIGKRKSRFLFWGSLGEFSF